MSSSSTILLCLGGKRGADGGKAQVETILKIAREQYGLLSLTDVVLNHTANDSPWLVDHPEAGTVFRLISRLSSLFS